MYLNRPQDAAPGDSRRKHAAGVIFRTPHHCEHLSAALTGLMGSLGLSVEVRLGLRRRLGPLRRLGPRHLRRPLRSSEDPLRDLAELV